jgi:endogenous inhibitor of DNA gyrase (YacG/DUF329 family)
VTSDLPCPRCRTPAPRRDNPYRPFCSERCRWIDLGQWVEEGYRIAGDPVAADPARDPDDEPA